MPSSFWRPTVQLSSPHPPLPPSRVTLLVIQCAVVGRARWPSYHPRRSQIYAYVARWQGYRRSSLGPCVVNCSRALRRPSSSGHSGSSPRGVGNETAFQKKAMRRTRARGGLHGAVPVESKVADRRRREPEGHAADLTYCTRPDFSRRRPSCSRRVRARAGHVRRPVRFPGKSVVCQDRR
jgi:hypothetical protein